MNNDAAAILPTDHTTAFPEDEPGHAPADSVLVEAEKVVGQRDAIHGTERVSARIAQMWSAYLGRDINEVDVNQMMVLLKVARSAHNPNHRDHYVDIAGYTYLAAEAVGDRLT